MLYVVSPDRSLYLHQQIPGSPLFISPMQMTDTFSPVTQLASPLCRQASPSTEILTDVSIILETRGEAWLLLFNFKGTKWTSHEVSALSFCEPLFQQGVFFLAQHYGALSLYLCANCLDCWRWNGLLLRHFGHKWFLFYVLHHQPSCCHCISMWNLIILPRECILMNLGMSDSHALKSSYDDTGIPSIQ